MAQRVANQQRFCRGALAKDGRGRAVMPWDRRACRWDMLGALALECARSYVGPTRDRVQLAADSALTMAAHAAGYPGVVAANDAGGYSVMLELIIDSRARLALAANA